MKSYFHYTDSLNNVISIIENGFFVKQSVEVNPFYKLLIQDFNKNEIYKGYSLPMVCLCELPINSIRKHMNIYGSFAIGMNSKWVKRNGFNPVMYFTETSSIILNLYKEIKQYVEEKEEGSMAYNRRLKIGPYNLFNEFFHYLKPYETNNYKKNGQSHLKYCFYNEHEWRFSPTNRINNYLYSEHDHYSNPNLIQKLNTELLSEKRIFSIFDIDYLFVQKQNQADTLLMYFKSKLSKREIEMLTLKTIIVEKLITS